MLRRSATQPFRRRPNRLASNPNARALARPRVGSVLDVPASRFQGQANSEALRAVGANLANHPARRQAAEVRPDLVAATAGF